MFSIHIRPLLWSIILTFLFLETHGQEFRIHSHNDYLRHLPFWEAASAKAMSIEVDVILLRDTLFVAHEKVSVRSLSIFDNMYLEP